jgi:hypothetical protein
MIVFRKATSESIKGNGGVLDSTRESCCLRDGKEVAGGERFQGLMKVPKLRKCLDIAPLLKELGKLA